MSSLFTSNTVYLLISLQKNTNIILKLVVINKRYSVKINIMILHIEFKFD